MCEGMLRRVNNEGIEVVCELWTQDFAGEMLGALVNVRFLTSFPLTEQEAVAITL